MMKELAEHLADTGMRVDIVTSVPNHPSGIIHGGWKNRLVQIETLRPGVRVVRVGAFLRSANRADKPRSFLHRLLGYLTFTGLMSSWGFRHVRPRIIFGVLQPLSVGPVLRLIARMRHSRLVFNIQDLHPDAAISLGLVTNRLMIRVLKRMERGAYVKADALAVICEGFRTHCVAHGASSDHVEVIPNWIDLDEVRPQSMPSRLRAELGLSADDFVVLYAGTIGFVSGAGVVLEAAECLRNRPDIHVVFVGDGQLVPALRRDVAARKLTRVHFLPFQGRDRLNDVQALGDVSIVTLLRGHGRTSVPSKVLAYMAAGRAVIASVDLDSETASLVLTARAGEVTPAEDAPALAKTILGLATDRARAAEMGDAGRRYLEAAQSKRAVLDRYSAMFARVMGWR
jgi:colanic acid biosynthesis glycosyl transferase WcaI